MVKVSRKTKTETIPKKVAKIHLGLCQLGTDIEGDLTSLRLNDIVVIHKFDTPDQLYEHNQRSYIDLVLMASGPDKSWITDMIRRIKSQSILEYIPIMVFAPEASRELVISILREGGDEVTVDDWDREVVSAKIEMLINRSRRDLGVNPSSRLPGPTVIEHEIDRRLKAGR
jgi:DNA-binding response OmpR family regulator